MFKILLVAFLVCFGIILGIRGLILLGIGPVEDYNTVTSFWDHAWYVFLQMTDPGNMSEDNDSNIWLKTTTITAGLVGVIILSMLIAFITTTLESLLFEFRKGRGRVLEKNHTLGLTPPLVSGIIRL